MSSGIQETVRLGLLDLARKVGEGQYGEGDKAFEANSDSIAFMGDLEDEVIGKME